VAAVAKLYSGISSLLLP